MEDNKQYFRKTNAGDVSVEGRQSNGMSADNNGNVFLYSGLKDSELKDLMDSANNEDIPYYYGNSYIAIAKSQTHDNIVLGNEKWDLDEPDIDPNKITTTNDDTGLVGDYKKLETLSPTTQKLILESKGLVLVREGQLTRTGTNAGQSYVPGTMWYKGKVIGFTCEDPQRKVKINSQTSIPPGNYVIKLDTTGEPKLTKYYVKFSDYPTGVFARIGEDKNAININRDGLKFAGIRIHGGWNEKWSAGCIIYDCVRLNDGSFSDKRTESTYFGSPNDTRCREHNFKLTRLIHDDKIDHIDIVHEFDNTPPQQTPSKKTGGYTTTITTNATITIPNGLEGDISVLVFYPGMDIGSETGKVYMPKKIKNAVPEWYDKYVIIVPNTYTTLWDNVKKEYEQEIEKVKLKTKDISIGIFSGSGNNGVSIMKKLGSITNIKNFMIMDPYPGTLLTIHAKNLTKLGVNVFLTYREGNWGSTGGYSTGIKELENVVIKKLNTSSSGYDHPDQPGILLKNFKTDIEQTLSTPTTTSVSTIIIADEEVDPAPIINNDVLLDYLPEEEFGQEGISSTYNFNQDDTQDTTDYSADPELKGKNPNEIAEILAERIKKANNKLNVPDKNSVTSKTNNKLKTCDPSQWYNIYGTIDELIKNNDKYGNLGDEYYHSTALYSQGSSGYTNPRLNWGSINNGGEGSMASNGCCMTAMSMLITYATQDTNYTPYFFEHDKGISHAPTGYHSMASIAKVKIKGLGEKTCGNKKIATIDQIDKYIKTGPVVFEWQNKQCSRTVGTSWAQFYAANLQHWLIIVGKYKDGTYCIFDPNQGKIRKHASAASIAAGLTRIFFVTK